MANSHWSSFCWSNRKKSKWTMLFSSATMQLKSFVLKCERKIVWTCQASDAQSPDSSEGAAEATTDSAPTPRTSLSAPSPGLRAPCMLPTTACMFSQLISVSVTICAWKHVLWKLAQQGHLAAMIRSSRRFPFFSQLESATRWRRDSPLDDGTHLDKSWDLVKLYCIQICRNYIASKFVETILHPNLVKL